MISLLSMENIRQGLQIVCRKRPKSPPWTECSSQRCSKMTAQPSKINVQFLCLWIQSISASSAYAKSSWRHWFSRWLHFEIMGGSGWGCELRLSRCRGPTSRDSDWICQDAAWTPRLLRAAQVILMCMKVWDSFLGQARCNTVLLALQLFSGMQAGLTGLTHFCGHLNMTNENIFKSMSKMSFLYTFTLCHFGPSENNWKGRMLLSQSQFAALNLMSFKTRTLCLPTLPQVITASWLSGTICTVNWGQGPLGRWRLTQPRALKKISFGGGSDES